MTKERESLKLALEALKNQFDSDNWKIALATQIIEGALANHQQATKRKWVTLTPANFQRLEQLYSHHVASDFALADIVCMAETILKEKNA